MDTITIKDKKVYLATPEGKELSMSVEDLFRRLLSDRGDAGELRPNGVRMSRSAGPLTVWVVEIPPSVRQLKWIANDTPARYGRGSKYRMVRIGLPYLVLFVVFENGMLSHSNECFFRVEPLSDEKKDELLFPALLNCSRFEPAAGKPLSWICTEKLDGAQILKISEPRQRMRKGLELLCRCLLEAGFNYSSERHEFSSWFSESRHIDPRISTIDDWQKATGKDPLFVLDIPWLRTGKTVEQIIERILHNRRAPRRGIRSAQDLARIIVNHATS